VVRRITGRPDSSYTPDIVADGLAAFTGTPRRRPEASRAPEIAPRPPVLCPGCGHCGADLAARTVFGDGGIYFNDIGCYTLGFGPPLDAADALLAMGSSIALASAASRVLARKTLAFIGDSTFFHSGMPALLNAAEAGDDVVVVVLDNRVTAMTGHQPSPTTPLAAGDVDSRGPVDRPARGSRGAGAGARAEPRRLRREDLGFSWGPIREVAYLFAGIFMTIIPALAILTAGEGGALAFLIEAVRKLAHYFLAAGGLSSFLDNAPTFLTFFSTVLGRFYPGLPESAAVQLLIADQKVYLQAVDAGAVFMGANTYIGNAPNFMVK